MSEIKFPESRRDGGFWVCRYPRPSDSLLHLDLLPIATMTSTGSDHTWGGRGPVGVRNLPSLKLATAVQPRVVSFELANQRGGPEGAAATPPLECCRPATNPNRRSLANATYSASIGRQLPLSDFLFCASPTIWPPIGGGRHASEIHDSHALPCPLIFPRMCAEGELRSLKKGPSLWPRRKSTVT
jgi:hypothetical protein